MGDEGQNTGICATTLTGGSGRVTMIAEQMATKLRDAANSVLEMMFMAPVLADQEFPPRDVARPLLVGLEFAGEANGSFTLALSTATAQSLALNFMGMSPWERLERQDPYG